MARTGNTAARTRPPGGPAAIAGFAYQLLGSVAWVTDIVIQAAGDTEPDSITVTFEPTMGGDAIQAGAGQAEVVQYKAGSSRGWTDTALAKGVLPDLARAARSAAKGTSFRLQTEAADRRSQALLRLQDLLQKEGPSRGLSMALAEGLRFPSPDEGGEGADAAQFVSWITRIASPKTGSAVTSRHVTQVLADFSVTAELAYDVVVERIDQALARTLAYPNRAVDRRNALLGHLMTLAQRGDARCTLSEMLATLLIPIAELASNARLEFDLASRLDRDLQRLGYARSDDARATSPPREGDGPLVFGGPSGVGKTWLLARAAVAARDEGALVVWIDSPGSRAEVRRAVTDRVQAARGVQDRKLNPEALGEMLAKISTPSVPYRLCVCLDRFTSMLAAADVLTDPWWREQGIDVIAALPATAAGSKISGLHVVETPAYTTSELRAFLKAHGRSWAELAHDVRRLIARPGLAQLFIQVTTTASGYQPQTEYELVRRAWETAPSTETVEWRTARAKIVRHTTAMLNAMVKGKTASYPWTVGARQKFSTQEAKTLEQGALLRWTADDRVEFDHDRLLAWGLAEAAAGLVREQKVNLDALADLAVRALGPGGDLAGVPRHAIAYFPMDLLWRLTEREEDADAALVVLKALVASNRGLEWSDIATLGPQGLSLLLGAAEAFDEKAIVLPGRLGAAIAAASPKPMPKASAGRVDRLLTSPETLRRRVALGVLRNAPRSGTLRRLIRVNAAARVAYQSGGDQKHDRYAEWDQAFPAARAVALAYPAEFKRVLAGALSGAEAHTVGWLIMDFPPAEASALWIKFAPHLPDIEDEERDRLAASAVRIGGEADLRARIAQGPFVGEYAFELLTCADPAAARSHLERASGKSALAALGGLELLARSGADIDEVVANLIDGEVSCQDAIWEMGPWEAVAGPRTWKRLVERVAFASKDNFHTLRRFGTAPSADLLPVLEASGNTRFEAAVERIAKARLANEPNRFVDSDLENAEEILLRIGGRPFERQIVRRLQDLRRDWHDAGADAALISDARNVRRAHRAMLMRLWQAGPAWQVPLNPLSAFAACDPVGARMFARQILRVGRSDSATYASQIALYLDDARLGREALAIMRTQTRPPLRIVINTMVAFADEPKPLLALGRKALKTTTPDGRYFAAWIADHIGDRRLQRRVIDQLIPVIRHRVESGDRNALNVLMKDPVVRAELLALVQDEPNTFLGRQIREAAEDGEWDEPSLEESRLDAALQFDSGFLNTPRDGQEKLLEGRLEVGLEVFIEGLRRGGRASAGLSEAAIRNHPEAAPPLILQHLLDVEDDKVRLDVGRALRAADWSMLLPLIAERLRSEDIRDRLTGLEAASWFPDRELEALVLGIRRSDPRGAVQKAAGQVHDRWDVLRFLGDVAERLPESGDRRRQLIAIMSGADTFSVMRTHEDPMFVHKLGLDLRERFIVEAFKNRQAK